MKHMPLDEWDKKIAPLLGAIAVRANAALSDIRQIREWVEMLPARPEFETVALDKINSITTDISKALDEIIKARNAYEGKDMVS